MDGAGDGDRLALAAGQRADRATEAFEVGIEPPHDLAGRLHLGVRGGRDLDRHHLFVSEVDALAAAVILQEYLDTKMSKTRGTE